MSRQISEERQAAYYIGGALSIIGILMFVSVFFSAGRESGDGSILFRALGGMALIAVGRIIQGIGEKGLAGSGVILDPEQAREDLEPYSRMAGGMVKDALDEPEIDLSTNRPEPEKVVMIKCRSCAQLNEENSKFCQECGQPL